MATKKTAVKKVAPKKAVKKTPKASPILAELKEELAELKSEIKDKQDTQEKLWKLQTEQADLEDKIRELENPRDKKLETKFLTVLDETHKQIQVHLKAAKAEIKKAESLSNKTGIPFSTDVNCETWNEYVPASFAKKWKELSEEFLVDLSDDEKLPYIYTDARAGWQQSYC